MTISTPARRLWASLRSLRLTLALLAYGAVSMAVVTLVPQGRALAFYIDRFGEAGGTVLYALGIDRFFVSPWFYLPVTLFGLNLSACTAHRLVGSVRRRAFGRIGADVAHLGFLLLLVAGLLSLYGRQSAGVTVLPGDTVSVSGGYELELLDARAEYYADGAPKAYHSVVLIRRPNGESRRVTIGVNEPARIGGIRVLQQSMGAVEESGGQAGVTRLLFVRDPGFVPALVAFSLILVGTVWSFFVRDREVTPK